MGIIIAKFRKKTSTYDTLSKLQDEILSIEEFQKRTQQTQRKIVFRFIILAILIYIALAFLLYLYFSQISPNQKLLWSIPLITFPLVIWFIKKFLTWYYNRKIKKNEKKLISLKEKKKQIIENVLETETYKVAKEILDKFGNQEKKPSIFSPVVKSISASDPPNQSGIRHRNIFPNAAARRSFEARLSTPVNVLSQNRLALPSPNARAINVSQTPQSRTPTGTPFPRGILPRDRSVLDKMVDYLVGDGPSNRYALICQKCSSHNGMALKEEFEYLSFRCCYCSHFNLARKKKPVGPKFESPVSPLKAIKHAESSDSEKNSENDSDAEPQPLIEEPTSDSGTEERAAEESKMEVDDDTSADTARITDVTESGDGVDNSTSLEN